MNLTEQTRREQLSLILQDIELALREYDLWLSPTDERFPSEQDLQSVQPFCMDTMAFEAWLQCVLLVRFNHMLKHEMPLPMQCDIYPMAQEYLKQQAFPSLLLAIKALDKLLTVSKG